MPLGNEAPSWAHALGVNAEAEPAVVEKAGEGGPALQYMVAVGGATAGRVHFFAAADDWWVQQDSNLRPAD